MRNTEGLIMKDKHYTCIEFKKIKSENANKYSLKNAEAHNTREEENFTPNSNPEKRNLNKDIIALKDGSYVNAFRKEEQKAIENGQHIRKDAVKALEVVAAFNKPDYDNATLEAWSKDVLEWVKEKFGGEQNIKHAVLHMDESTPHIHIVLVPIDERGRLNSSAFWDGPYDTSRKQTDFYEKVGKKYGLSRGVEGRTKRKLANNYKTMIKYKEATLGKALSNTIELDPKKEELDESGHIIPELYIPRVKEIVEKEDLRHLAQENDLKQEVNEQEGELLKQRNEIYRLIEKQKKALKKIADLFGLVKDDLLSGKIAPHDIKKRYEYYDALNRGLKNDKYPNKAEQTQTLELVDKIAKWQHQKDKDVKQEILEKYDELN